MRSRWIRQRLIGVRSAWFITATLMLLSASLGLFELDDGRALHPEIELPWWALAVAFAVVESFVVHLHFRSEAGSFSLFEVPLVIGLIFAAPQELWISAIIGVTFAFTVVRRQPAIKVAFNIANLSMHVAVAAFISQAIITGDPLSPFSWLALAGATSVGGGLQILALAAVIAAS